MFGHIVYYNRTNRLLFDIVKQKPTNNSNFYSNSELSLTHFYFLGLKCFKINLKIKYREEDLYLLDDKNILDIHLKKKLENA